MELEKSDVSHHEIEASAAVKPGGSPSHEDSSNHLDQTKGYGDQPLRLDKRGLPLVPQPTSHKDDPLNWSPMLKLFVTLQISWLALLGPMSAAVVNPAFVPLSKAFDITIVQATYELTVYIVFGGIGPMAVVPFANVYGRRPVYLLGNMIAAITNIIAGYCSTWAGVMVTRAINGLAAGSTVAIGGATICDLYFQHERGLYMGIYTFFLTNGPHVAPLIGGFIAQYIGWRACFYIPGYIQLGSFVVTLFTLPETIYSRTEALCSTHREHSYMDLLLFKRSRLADRQVHFRDFTRPFEMLKYFAVAIPSVFYMACFGYGTVLFAATGAQLFGELYHFHTEQTGLLLSIPLLIGCLIGEFNAGWVTDWMSNRYARTHNGERLPEARLNAIWGAVLVPVGVIIQGVCLSHSKTVGWIGTAFGMGIAGLGLQISTTVIYAYITDCYKPQSAEISTVLNTFRQIFSCFISFYAIPLAKRIGVEYAWLVFAMITLALMLPVLMLRVYGPRLRSLPSQAPPTFHNDI